MIDESRRQVVVRGTAVELTPTEWGILVALATVPGRVYSRFELINRVRGYEFEGYERTIDSHVKNLRRKIERTLAARDRADSAGRRLPAGPDPRWLSGPAPPSAPRPVRYKVIEKKKKGDEKKVKKKKVICHATRGSALGLRLALAFLAVALAAVALLAGLTAAFAAADVSGLASHQRTELTSAIAAAAAAAWDRGDSWASADLSPVLDLAARTGAEVQIRDRPAGVGASPGFAAQASAPSRAPVM